MDYSVETGAFGDLKPGNDLVFLPTPLHPNKNTPSLDVPTNRPSRYTWFFLKSSLLFNGTIVPSSGERRKKRLPKIVKIILKIQSGKHGLHFTFWKVSKPHLSEWLGKPHHNHRRFTKSFQKKKIAKIMFSFISWNLHTNGQKFNLHEGWDEWFHYHLTHQQQETP